MRPISNFLSHIIIFFRKSKTSWMNMHVHIILIWRRLLVIYLIRHSPSEPSFFLELPVHKTHIFSLHLHHIILSYLKARCYQCHAENDYIVDLLNFWPAFNKSENCLMSSRNYVEFFYMHFWRDRLCFSIFIIGLPWSSKLMFKIVCS